MDIEVADELIREYKALIQVKEDLAKGGFFYIDTAFHQKGYMFSSSIDFITRKAMKELENEAYKIIEANLDAVTELLAQQGIHVV